MVSATPPATPGAVPPSLRATAVNVAPSPTVENSGQALRKAPLWRFSTCWPVNYSGKRRVADFRVPLAGSPQGVNSSLGLYSVSSAKDSLVPFRRDNPPSLFIALGPVAAGLGAVLGVGR